MNKPSPTGLPPLIPLPATIPPSPDMSAENALYDCGYQYPAGVDEAGRGPLAGPLVAACVILDRNALPEGIDDSKKLSAARRNQLFHQIVASGHVAIATVNASVIDKINIRQATLQTMERAFHALEVKADWGLIDGRDIPQTMPCHATALIKGDRRSMSIAAASIVAKVVRDNIMIRAAQIYPQYRFENHKGYGTKAHRDAIAHYGPCPLHRYSFAPIRSSRPIAGQDEVTDDS